MKNILYELKEWLTSIVAAFLLALTINILILQPTEVIGNSMQPTLENHNYLLISKLGHTLRHTPDYNDIVIIDSRVLRDRTWKDDITDSLHTYLSAFGQASQPHDMWIKRVIGKPGDELEFKNNTVIRNGTVLKEPYIKETMHYSTGNKIVVPPDHVFVMGDNRNNSMDSRYIGPIPIDHIVGTMLIKIK